jgi:DNA-dependent RNA polymerase auxiliary subunit epsilon
MSVSIDSASMLFIGGLTTNKVYKIASKKLYNIEYLERWDEL